MRPVVETSCAGGEGNTSTDWKWDQQDAQCSCTTWDYRGPCEISSCFPHDERPLLRNSVTMTERLRDAGMEANAKYYPVSLIGISPYLWLLKYPLTYSSLTSPRLDGFPSSRLKDSVVSRKVTVISVEHSASLSSSIPIKQSNSDNWSFMSQSSSLGKSAVKWEPPASPTT